MSKNILKEDLIYVKNDQIPKSLLSEIINNMERCEKYEKNERLIKIYLFLKKIIKQNLFTYVNKVNESGCLSSIFNYTDIKNISNLKVSKKQNDEPLIDCKRIFNSVNSKFKRTLIIKKLNFILFLNDFDGEICFWKDFKIIPKAGTLIIFPASWCYPFSEFIKPNKTALTMTGYVYNEQNIEVE